MLFNIEETVFARYKLEMEYQMKAVRYKAAENISILMVKFSKICKFVVENPLDRFMYWMAKEMYKRKTITKEEMDMIGAKGIPK